MCWLCVDDVREVLAKLYVSQLRLFCTLAQFQHQIVAVMEVREMPSATRERADEAVLASYDLAPDKTCRWSPLPDHQPCGAVASYGLDAWDDTCAEPWQTYACDRHAHTVWTAAREGRWCVCTGHKGHVMAGVRLGRLV